MIEESQLIEIKPSFGLLLRVWWGYTWRCMFVGFTLCMGLFAFVYVASVVTGPVQFSASPAAMSLYAGIAFFAVSCIANYLGMKLLIGQRFAGHRLVLLTPQVVEELDRSKDPGFEPLPAT